MARCYILASMSNILQRHHENMATAYDMMMNLKEIFGEQNRAGRQVVMKALLNTKMAEGTPVQDHVLKMISHLNDWRFWEQRLTVKAKSISCSCLYLSPIRTSALITL